MSHKPEVNPLFVLLRLAMHGWVWKLLGAMKQIKSLETSGSSSM